VLANPFGPGPVHCELKTADLSANPYVALSGVLAAGRDGIERKLPLGEPVQHDPGGLTDEQRAAAGIDRLPVNLEDALLRLEEDAVLTEALGEPFGPVYRAVRRFEQQQLKDHDLKAERQLLLTRY